MDNCEVQEMTGEGYSSTIILNRLGEVQLPVEVKVTMDNGETQIYPWDGAERSAEIVVTGAYKVVQAEIDPEGKCMLDHNVLNNALMVTPRPGPIRSLSARLLTAFQHTLEFITLLV